MGERKNWEGVVKALHVNYATRGMQLHEATT